MYRSDSRVSQAPCVRHCASSAATLVAHYTPLKGPIGVAANTPMMLITISNSINANPLVGFLIGGTSCSYRPRFHFPVS